MSEYFLADRKAEERAKQRGTEAKPAQRNQDIKAVLLGDFVIPNCEPTGADPYNSTQGKAARNAWQARRNR